MKAGTIQFRGINLGLLGNPQFTLRKTPEPPAPALATHRRIEIQVTLEIRAEMSATIWARVRALQGVLAQAAEGPLEIVDENGTVCSWQAVPGENSLPQAIQNKAGRVEMNFTALEAVDAALGMAMTIDPLDGGAVVGIPRVLAWSQNVRPVRPDSRNGHRSEVGSAVTFGARTAYADLTLPAEARAETLMAEAARLRRLDGLDCRIQFADFDQVVQVESLEATISEGWQFITLQCQARYNVLPDETVAEANFKAESEDNSVTGEIRTTVSGLVRAADETAARTKAAAIITAYHTSGRRLEKSKLTPSYLDGADSPEAPDFTQLEFEAVFSQTPDSSHYSLRVETRESTDGRRITYSGSAHCPDLGSFNTLVAALAVGRHPIEISFQSTAEYVTDNNGSEVFVEGSFSVEYAVAALFFRAAVDRQSGGGKFGDNTVTVSGSITAPTQAAARTMARKFIDAGVILRTDDESAASAGFALASATSLGQQFTTLKFSYAWQTAHGNTAISYKDTSAPDYTRMVMTRTLSGTCWATGRAAAKAAVIALITSLALDPNAPSSSSLTDSLEFAAGPDTSNWLAVEFTYTFEGALTGSIGHDIIEASVRLQRTGQVNHEPITEVPLARPIRQIAFGYNIGRLVVSGSIKARQMTTAVAWGQSRRPMAASANGVTGAPDPPEETLGMVYLPFNGSTLALHTFDFSYPFRYQDGLDGLMDAAAITIPANPV